MLVKFHSPAPHEVREGDLSALSLPITRDEEQLLDGPRLALGAVGRRAFSEDGLTKDSPQGDDWQTLGLKLYEENAPRLIRCERAKTFDLLDLCRVLGVDPEFFRCCIAGTFRNTSA